VPSDCLLDAASELENSAEVAILQFSSGVMNVTKNYFEMGITFFTNLIYSAIRYGVANGDVAPFVGHNAILRWSALQDVAYEDEGKTKFWSEPHVSEDFDMALRLQIKGYITRLAAWAGDGFPEGVSLTVSGPAVSMPIPR
jgi:cellulose synthase/poly-beta-1,6-N-acetylglucosamine synthase-like glycosyltransferase